MHRANSPLKKRFDRAYLHIGLGKTGSTAIQKVFWTHADILESGYSIHYPTVPVISPVPVQQGNHSEPLLCMFHPQPEKLRRNILRGNNTREKALAFGQKLRADFEHGFEQSNARELLLSAEGIPTHLQRSVMGVAEWLDHWCDDLRLVACVRHPTDSLSSQIQQRLKVGETLEAMYSDPPLYLYDKLFPRLEKIFGGRSIHLYDFADAVEDRSGLANRLLRELGLDIELPQLESSKANPSMSQDATLLLDSLNRQYPPIVDGKLKGAGKNAAFTWCQQVPGQKYHAPARVYEKLEELAAPQLAWLEEHYQLRLRSRYRQGAAPPPADMAKVDRRARRLHWIAQRPTYMWRTLLRLTGDDVIGPER